MTHNFEFTGDTAFFHEVEDARQEVFEVEDRDVSEPVCVECGASLDGVWEAWAEDGVCSGNCWRWLFGEWE